MAVRKSMTNMLLDSNIHSTPTSSSPLRRRSMLPQVAFTPSTLLENDDEAERLARRREITDTSTPLSSISGKDRRHSLGLGFLVHMPASQMAERISQCIKLGAENKINPKNAFSLELIDFMTYMIKKKDTNMSNLQVATTSLDVSTKIYGFRVDGVHMEILKMAGGLDMQGRDHEHLQNIGKSNTQEMALQEGIVEDEGKQKQRSKRKKNKQRIFTSVEALRTSIDVEKHSLLTLEADLQTTDMLYQAMLPNHANSKFYQHPYNDVLVDTVNCEDAQDNDTVYNIPRLPDFSHLEICSPLFYFDFQKWNADDEPDNVEVDKNNDSRFLFDLDASLPHNEERISTGMNYFDIENVEDNNVKRCAMISTEVENIVDFREVLSSATLLKDSEYSFVQKNINMHWAGPSHWKASNFIKAFSNSRVIETCRQAPMRKRKEIELIYDDEVIKSVNLKFVRGQMVKLHAKTAKTEWNEEILTLPPDEHYDITKCRKLYLHQTVFKHLDDKIDMNVTSLSEDNDNIPNYCLNMCNEQHHQSEENDMQHEDGGMLGSQMPFTGDNLIAIPKLTNKLSIAYSVRTKKIDMRQLKQTIWRCLTRENPPNIQEKRTEIPMQYDTNNAIMYDTKYFSGIYKELPSMLTKTNVEALSFPISFVSLLHLANEKTLKISSPSDMADLIIQQD